MKGAISSADADRRRRIGKIHQHATALGLDRREYRALLMRATSDEYGVGGIDSSGNMTEAQHLAVLRELGRIAAAKGVQLEQNAARRRQFQGKPKNTSDVPMLRKVEALLADAKRPWDYAHAMADQMFKVKRLEWLTHDQLHRLVAALQIDANRAKPAKEK
jgi:phage gp16-like protein